MDDTHVDGTTSLETQQGHAADEVLKLLDAIHGHSDDSGKVSVADVPVRVKNMILSLAMDDGTRDRCRALLNSVKSRRSHGGRCCDIADGTTNSGTEHDGGGHGQSTEDIMRGVVRHFVCLKEQKERAAEDLSNLLQMHAECFRRPMEIRVCADTFGFTCTRRSWYDNESFDTLLAGVKQVIDLLMVDNDLRGIYRRITNKAQQTRIENVGIASTNATLLLNLHRVLKEVNMNGFLAFDHHSHPDLPDSVRMGLRQALQKALSQPCKVCISHGSTCFLRCVCKSKTSLAKELPCLPDDGLNLETITDKNLVALSQMGHGAAEEQQDGNDVGGVDHEGRDRVKLIVGLVGGFLVQKKPRELSQDPFQPGPRPFNPFEPPLCSLIESLPYISSIDMLQRLLTVVIRNEDEVWMSQSYSAIDNALLFIDDKESHCFSEIDSRKREFSENYQDLMFVLREVISYSKNSNDLQSQQLAEHMEQLYSLMLRRVSFEGRSPPTRLRSWTAIDESEWRSRIRSPPIPFFHPYA